MQKHDAWRFVRHVIVDRHDIDACFAQRFQHRLQFIFRHREVAIDHGVIVTARIGSLGVDADFFSDLDTVHARFPADDEFHHSVFCFALESEDLVQWSCGD